MSLAASAMWLAVGAAAASPLPPTRAGYPTKPITLVAPANPGGGWDQLARLIRQVLASERIVAVPVEVVNRGGAGGTIGLAELVTRHRRDPHTILVGGGVMLGAILTHGSPFGFDDTVPLARLVSEYEVVAVAAGSRYSTLSQLIADFRAHPSAITWGGGSAGGIDHILLGLIAQTAGVPLQSINYVAFAGGGEAAAAVMGSQVTAGVSGLGEWKGHVDAGRLRYLGVSSPERLPGEPTPTFRDSGLDVVLANWRCLLAPPGTDEETRDWLTTALARMRASAAWQEILERNQWEDSFLAGDDFARFVQEEQARTAMVLTTLGLGAGGQGYAALGPYFFPLAIGVGFAVSGALVFLGPRHEREPANWRTWGGSAALMLAYVLSFEPAGFLVATTTYLFLQARLLGSRAWLRDAAFILPLTVGIYVVFKKLLQIALPPGILG